LHGLDSPALTSVVALRSTITAAVLDNGAVLLDLDSKYFYALNASGWAIVQLFESGAAVDAAKAQASAWGAPADGRVDAFVAQLQGFGLLEHTGLPAIVAQIDPPGTWTAPTIERQAEPLQNVMVSAFDPSFPLGE
jgi:hypothetical protein